MEVVDPCETLRNALVKLLQKPYKAGILFRDEYKSNVELAVANLQELALLMDINPEAIGTLVLYDSDVDEGRIGLHFVGRIPGVTTHVTLNFYGNVHDPYKEVRPEDIEWAQITIKLVMPDGFDEERRFECRYRYM